MLFLDEHLLFASGAIDGTPAAESQEKPLDGRLKMIYVLPEAEQERDVLCRGVQQETSLCVTRRFSFSTLSPFHVHYVALV